MDLHQTPEQIIKNASAPLRILWNQIFLQFGKNISISPNYYQGLKLNSRFTIYNPRIIYLACEVTVSHSAGFVTSLTPLRTMVYDEFNQPIMMFCNVRPVWNTTAAAMQYNNLQETKHNFYFSRLDVEQEYLSFNGYIIGI